MNELVPKCSQILCIRVRAYFDAYPAVLTKSVFFCFFLFFFLALVPVLELAPVDQAGLKLTGIHLLLVLKACPTTARVLSRARWRRWYWEHRELSTFHTIGWTSGWRSGCGIWQGAWLTWSTVGVNCASSPPSFRLKRNSEGQIRTQAGEEQKWKGKMGIDVLEDLRSKERDACHRGLMQFGFVSGKGSRVLSVL